MTLKKRLLALCMAVVMVFSLCSISAFAAAPTDDKQPVVIGRYDAPLSECLEPGMAIEIRLFAIVLYVLHNAAPHHDDRKHCS